MFLDDRKKPKNLLRRRQKLRDELTSSLVGDCFSPSMSDVQKWRWSTCQSCISLSLFSPWTDKFSMHCSRSHDLTSAYHKLAAFNILSHHWHPLVIFFFLCFFSLPAQFASDGSRKFSASWLLTLREAAAKTADGIKLLSRYARML